MKKLLNSMGARICAFILIVASCAAFLVSVVGIGALYSADAYKSTLDETRAGMFENWCYMQAEDALSSFAVSGSAENISTDSAFAYTITDKDGKVVCDTVDGRSTIYKVNPLTIDYVLDVDGSEERGIEIHRGTYDSGYVWTARSASRYQADGSDETADNTEETADTAAAQDESGRDYADFDYRCTPYSITGYILEDIPQNSEIYHAMRLAENVYGMRYDILATAVGSAVLALLLFVFLMASAGRRAPDGEITPGFSEKLPFDVFTVIIFTICACCLAFFLEMADSAGTLLNLNVVVLTVTGVLVIAGISFTLWWCMSLAVRIKLKNTIKSCICYKLAAWLWRGIKKISGSAAYVFKCIPFIPRAVLIMLGVLFVEFVFIAAAGSTSSHLTGWFFERALLAAFMVYVLASMKKLLIAGREIANGNTDYRVDVSKLRGPLKQHGEDLNSITDGMNKAVNDRLKSERFRTELITNVSHDIKTPLTSIINYVDLMEKEGTENEKMKEYLDVLARQSARLKKLIEDLMEASKASTGNLAVNPERCELGVLLTQTAGEYEEKLKKAGLELIIDKPDDPVVIMADRQHLWRIFDNLMNNICKYSMPGTRVYLTLKRSAAIDGDSVRARALVTFRNISKTRLNVSEEELMERFVRGDSSRNTEGSGLGLSIASSLTKLQKGTMDLVVDGDLFKVSLCFDAVD